MSGTSPSVFLIISSTIASLALSFFSVSFSIFKLAFILSFNSATFLNSPKDFANSSFSSGQSSSFISAWALACSSSVSPSLCSCGGRFCSALILRRSLITFSTSVSLITISFSLLFFLFSSPAIFL